MVRYPVAWRTALLTIVFVSALLLPTLSVNREHVPEESSAHLYTARARHAPAQQCASFACVPFRKWPVRARDVWSCTGLTLALTSMRCMQKA